jgi:NADH-quinone oxidoreductase subunit C
VIAEKLLEYPLAREVDDRFPGAISDGHDQAGELTLFVDPSKIVEICRFLKEDGKFVRLSGITAVDWHPTDPRFEVVYHLHSIERNLRLRLKCRVAESSAEIDSLTGVWRGANWYEREIFDMFGITFRNHPDLTRILMPDDWEGYPLRKDFPIDGNRYGYKNE